MFVTEFAEFSETFRENSTEAWIGLNLKILSVMCLTGSLLASWSLAQEVAGLSPLMTNIFVTEFWKHLGKTPVSRSVGFWRNIVKNIDLRNTRKLKYNVVGVKLDIYDMV